MDGSLGGIDLLQEQEELSTYQIYDVSHNDDMEADEDEPFLSGPGQIDIDLTDDSVDEPHALKRHNEAELDESAKRLRVTTTGRVSVPINPPGSSLGPSHIPTTQRPVLPQVKIPIQNNIVDLQDDSDDDESFDDHKPLNVPINNMIDESVDEKSNNVELYQVENEMLDEFPQETMTNTKDVVPSTSSPLQKTSKKCIFCRSKKGDVVLCLGCWIPVHPQCIQGKKYCGSCTIALTTRTSQDIPLHESTTIPILNGLAYLNKITSNPQTFKLIGHVSSSYFHDLSMIAPTELKEEIEKSMPQYAQQWLASKLVEVKSSEKISTKDIINIISGLYGLKKSHLSSALADAIQEHVKRYSVVDYLGWDPKTEKPDVRYSNPCHSCGLRIARTETSCLSCNRPLKFPTKFEAYRTSIVLAYHAEQVGVSIGCSFLDVFSHWQTLRKSYLKKASTNIDYAIVTDQWRMICTMLEILSFQGSRELPRRFLDVEWNILSQVDQMNRWYLTDNLDLFGCAVYTLGFFSNSPEMIDQITLWQEMIREKQDDMDGSWGLHGAIFDYVEILRYKTTYSCLKALMPKRSMGYGPRNVDIWAYLQEWSRQKAIPCGILPSSRRFGNLRDLYRGQIMNGNDINPLMASTEMHLKGRLQEKGMIGISHGWRRLTVNIWEKSIPTDGNVLTMHDLSIFDGLKFTDGEIIDISQNILDDNGNDDDDDDVVDDDDEDETK